MIELYFCSNTTRVLFGRVCQTMLRWYVDDRVAGLSTCIFYRRQKTSQERDLN